MKCRKTILIYSKQIWDSLARLSVFCFKLFTYLSPLLPLTQLSWNLSNMCPTCAQNECASWSVSWIRSHVKLYCSPSLIIQHFIHIMTNWWEILLFPEVIKTLINLHSLAHLIPFYTSLWAMHTLSHTFFLINSHLGGSVPKWYSETRRNKWIISHQMIKHTLQ